MKTEKQLEQPIPSDEAVNPEEAVAQPTSRRVGYKTVLSAVVIGVLTITALWLFVIRQAPDVQAHRDTVATALPATKTDPAVVSIDRKITSITSQIDRSFEVQQIHSTVVKQELTAMTNKLQAIKAAIADLGEAHEELGRKISTGLSQLDALTKDVRALKVVKRKPVARRKARPIKTPPFHIDAIDVWDDVTYVAVSQAGRRAFLKTGEHQSGWKVTHINRLKGQVGFKGPAGQVHSVSLQR